VSDDLDKRLLDSHARQDSRALITLYAEAADATADEDARGFFLTHAYIFALEAGHGEANALRARLVAMGRETPSESV